AESHLSLDERINTNYDHPLACYTELIISHLKMLMDYKPLDKPIYDFTVHNRKKNTIRLEPTEVIVLEGILVLDCQDLRKLLDIKIIVDTDADVRLIRRITRDMRERGRSLESVIRQYIEVVKPMHNEFIEPTKRYADIIIPEGGYNKVAIDIMVTKVKSILRE
ncbi:MAG: uridine kinase, partial [Clostridiales bacterium]|nr:uridine kinase [Clostridiales bacterium]